MERFESLFSDMYRNKKVLITGHTGYKGSWLAFWLSKLGAELMGISLEPPTSPNHFDLLSIKMESITSDIRNYDRVKKSILKLKPEIVFHLAAQPLVRYSYHAPLETLETNVIGTANILEACRYCESIKAIVVISSDKCYENKEKLKGYLETDPMGGFDPYSASKGCTELIVSSYRNSFFNLKEYNKVHHVLVASARSGNVIGGGDWAKNRLIPDIVKSIVSEEEIVIRNPSSIRPWLHVLEPLSGYLLLGQLLLEGKREYAESWNFGPDTKEAVTVLEIVNKINKMWPSMKSDLIEIFSGLHESSILKLNCNKAKKIMKWQAVWNIETTINHTIQWYKKFYQEGKLFTEDDLDNYIFDAKKKNCVWAHGGKL